VYNNNLITGGNRFYARLQGDASFQNLRQDVTPTCEDTQNGRTICTYSPTNVGTHQLTIRLLNNSLTRPGGLGLNAKYYTTVDGAMNDRSDEAFSRIDPVVQFTWSSGLVVPTNDVKINVGSSAAPRTVPLSKGGQSIRWDGYLISPRNDYFGIVARSINLNSSVYIDDVLVFDTVSGISASVAMLQDSAYHIRVVTSAAPTLNQAPVARSIDLRWSTATVRENPIPQFFLYDSAEEIALSPFPVNVTAI